MLKQATAVNKDKMAVETEQKPKAEFTGPVVRRNRGGELMVVVKGEAKPVHLKLCFPWTDPRRYLSLRDHREQELLYVDKLQDLDLRSREALEGELAEAGFVLEISVIMSIREDFELRAWQVELADGSRRLFQTRLDDWPLRLPDGGCLIRDVAEDLYLVRDPAALDPRSRDCLGDLID